MAAGMSSAPYTALPATSTLAPASTHSLAVLAFTPPSTCSRQSGLCLSMRGAHLPDGVQLVLHEGLTAEAGLHGHYQHHVQLVQIGEDGISFGDGTEGHRLLHPAGLHAANGLGDAFGTGGLQMDGEQVRPRLGKGVDIPGGVGDHQMHVQEHVGGLAQGLHHRHADGDVGDELAVHHVHMHPVGSGNLFDIPFQIGEIGRKNGRCNFNHDFILISGRI